MEIIKLNLIPSGVNPICHAKQYDEGRIIRFMLFDGLTPYTLQSGDTVTLNLRKPDNTIIESSVTATQGNKYVDLVTTEQICAVAGFNLGTFKITNGSVEIGTLNFIMEVGKDVLANGIPSQSVIEDLDALVAEAVGDDYYNKTEIDAALNLKANSSDVDLIGEKVDYMIEEETDVKSSTAFTKYPEYSGNVYNGNNVRIESNANYDSYFLTLDKDCSIYFGDTLPAYVAICYGVPPCTKEPDRLRWGCTSATRYRNLDNNLPQSATPLSVAKNGIIVITVTKGATVSLFGLGLAYKFTDNAKAQIIDTVNIKKPLVTADTTASGYITERLYIRIPSKVGYVEYDFAHYINQSINANTWNIRITNAISDDLVFRYLITTTGEFECAIKIDGAPDFMGGIAHGSEVITGVQFTLDGKAVSLSDIQANTTFNELRVVVISNLYDPSDETTIAAQHSKEYIFNENGLTINQMVKWLGSYTLTDSYLAMFPTAKAVIDSLRVNNKIDTYDLSQTTPSISSGVNHAYTFGDDILCDFNILTWDIDAQSATDIGGYFISDNGGQNYYKQYYKALSSGTVANGDIWQTSTFYKIQIGA